MLWGYALVWMRQYMQRDPDPLMAKLKFLVDYDLQVTGIGLGEVAALNEKRLHKVGQFLNDHDLYLHIHAGADYMNQDIDQVYRQIDEQVEGIRRYHKILRTPLVTTGVASTHRFVREPSLDQQMERLERVLPILATGCHEIGIPFGIENHGDYYCSDLVALCQTVPHLGIFLDTGNTYLIGEAPLPAFEAAAPYVVGSHFKDHHVAPRPEARPLHFEVGPSIIGDGDVPLRECFQLLRQRAPQPEKLVMEIEFIPPSDIDPLESLERSLAFIRSLEKAS
jgi:sugar phosphate isomerase/epimerase